MIYDEEDDFYIHQEEGDYRPPDYDIGEMHPDDDEDSDECAFPGQCLMPGDHIRAECHNVEMVEAAAREMDVGSVLYRLKEKGYTRRDILDAWDSLPLTEAEYDQGCADAERRYYQSTE